MSKVFVDTAAWLALVNQDDDLHVQAIQVKNKLQTDKSFLITTDFIFLEVADALATLKFRRTTITYIQRLRELVSLRVLPVSEVLYTQGWRLYCQRLDKDWGLTDCISFVVMQQEGVSVAFTSDRHFEQAGFQRLLTPGRIDM